MNVNLHLGNANLMLSKVMCCQQTHRLQLSDWANVFYGWGAIPLCTYWLKPVQSSLNSKSDNMTAITNKFQGYQQNYEACIKFYDMTINAAQEVWDNWVDMGYSNLHNCRSSPMVLLYDYVGLCILSSSSSHYICHLNNKRNYLEQYLWVRMV